MKLSRLIFTVGLALALLAGAARADEAPTLRVLTFNVWGIFSGKIRPYRMREIAKAIATLDPDVIALEEAFAARHRQLILDGLHEAGYPVAGSRYYRKPYGSGVFLISKYPIRSTEFTRYAVQCGPFDIEYYAGKGIQHAVLETPHGPLDFYLTHVLSRTPAIFDAQGNFIPGDPFQTDRILQMAQIDEYLEATRDPQGRSLIAVGDFNVSPEMLEYWVLLKLSGLESSFETLHPGENPSTFSSADNWVTDDFSRIDHIFYKNFAGTRGFAVKPIESRVVLDQKVPGPDGTPVNLSDHYGFFTVFAVVETAPPSPERTAAPAELAEAYAKRDRKSAAVIPAAEKLTGKPNR